MRSYFRSALTGLYFLTQLAFGLGQVGNTQSNTFAPPSNQQPELRREDPSEAVSVEGLIRLDVVVMDPAGKAVTGLERTDFKVIENGSARTTVAFRAASQAPEGSGDALSVILLLDTVDQPANVADRERQQAADFLRRNAGKLEQPVTIYSLEPAGFFLIAGSSKDGEMLATRVLADQKAETYFTPREKFKRRDPEGDEAFDTFPVLKGLKALATISTQEVSRPGRKLLVWIGPGLSDRGTGAIAEDGQRLLGHSANSDGLLVRISGYSLSGQYQERNRRDLFEKVTWFSALLRQARITLDCLAADKDDEPASYWHPFLSSAVSLESANWMNLYKKVLAIQSGGRVFPFSQDRAGQIGDAINAEEHSYSLTFDPLPVREEEYHSLGIEMGRPDLTVRMTTGYYDEPYYDDPPDPAIRHVTASQLAILLKTPAFRRQPLPPVALTERLNSTEIQGLGKVHARPSRESLEAIAAESSFLEPPPSEILAEPAPDGVEQERILSAGSDYLHTAVAELPDIYANRIAVYYRGSPAQEVTQSKNTVVYRHGDELLVNNKMEQVAGDQQPLETNGTFGAILKMMQVVLATRGGITWKRWEKSAQGRLAVFAYAYPGTPMVMLVGCCFPNGPGHPQIGISAGAHGEVTIAPQSGAILRITVQHDIKGFVPTERADLEVDYGPVEIGGKTLIVPLQSVGIWRGRRVNALTLTQWDNLGFRVWGPYETQMNVFTFDHYHNFRSTARILPGFAP